MRVLSGALALLTACLCAASVQARTVSTPVSVYLTVAPGCTVQAPARTALQPAVTSSLRPPAGIVQALPEVALEMLLANCKTGVKPLLTLSGNGQGGVYVATIDF